MGKLMKGLAAAALIGAAAAFVANAAKKDPNVKAATKAAKSVAKRAADHAKKIGKITKSSYDAIVDKTVAEARGAKQLSESELKELRKELNETYKDMEKMLRGKKA